MNITKTDFNSVIRLLLQGSELIDKYCKKPKEQDTALRMRKIVKKLLKDQRQ